ncbi:unnamed protein product, partial [Durusdinium trenchii]
AWAPPIRHGATRHGEMRKTKSRSPARKVQKSSSLPSLKRTYVAPLQLCSVNIAKHSYSCKDVRLGIVEKAKPRRLPFMHVDRADDGGQIAQKLPSLRKIMNSIARMKLPEPGTSLDRSLQSGSLRSNPLFGGSPPFRGGPRLPIKHKRFSPGSLTKVKLPRSRPSSGRKDKKGGKRAAWGTETEFVEYNEEDSNDSQEEASEQSSDSDSSDSSSSSGSSSFSGSSDEHVEPPPEALRGRSTGMTRRMSAFAMMLPLLDSNNQPVRRASVAEVFLKAIEANKESQIEDNKPGDELDFPWSDEECRSVFIKFDTDTDGEVATEELELMLRYMGCILRKGEVDKLVAEMFSFATVSWEEWMTFLEKYREADEQYLRAEFDAADNDKNGVLDVDELNELLGKMGYVIDSHTVMEAMDTIGCGSKGTVDLRRFEKLREHLRCTEGLARADVRQLRSLYDRIAHTAKVQHRSRKMDIGVGSQQDIAKKLIAEQQEMPVEDVWRVVQYLGYKISYERVQIIAREVDNDASGYISFQELLKLVRRVRDAEREAISTVFEILAEEGIRLQLRDLGHALAELRYYVTEDLIKHILDHLRLKSNQYVTQDETVAFLNALREKDGFTPQERREMEGAFEHQCQVTAQRRFLQQLEEHPHPPKTGSPKTAPASPTTGLQIPVPASPKTTHASPRPPGVNLDAVRADHAVDALRASRVMRWFGFTKPLQQVQTMLDEIDLDARGKLEITEFLKLMQRQFSELRGEQWNLFTMLDNKGNDHVMVSKIPFAVQKLSQYGASIAKAEKAANENHFTLMDTKESVSRSTFQAFFKSFRRLEIDEMRQHACYNASEVLALRECFNKFDKDRSGTVEKRELAKIIAEYFPEATKSKEGRAEMQLILKDVDQDGNGALDFLEFLVLMRRCDDIRDESDIQLEETVAVALGIEADELEGYRSIFAAKANWVGELTPADVQSIMSYITEFSDEDVSALNAIVREVHPDHKLLMRFPQFLQVMKRLVDDNVGNINQHCERTLKRASQRGSLLL